MVLLYRAIRSQRAGVKHIVRQCCDSWGPLALCFGRETLVCANFQRLCNIVRALTPWHTTKI